MSDVNKRLRSRCCLLMLLCLFWHDRQWLVELLGEETWADITILRTIHCCRGNRIDNFRSLTKSFRKRAIVQLVFKLLINPNIPIDRGACDRIDSDGNESTYLLGKRLHTTYKRSHIAIGAIVTFRNQSMRCVYERRANKNVSLLDVLGHSVRSVWLFAFQTR